MKQGLHDCLEGLYVHGAPLHAKGSGACYDVSAKVMSDLARHNNHTTRLTSLGALSDVVSEALLLPASTFPGGGISEITLWLCRHEQTNGFLPAHARERLRKLA